MHVDSRYYIPEFKNAVGAVELTLCTSRVMFCLIPLKQIDGEPGATATKRVGLACSEVEVFIELLT